MSPSYAGIIAEEIKKRRTEEEIDKAAGELGKESSGTSSGGETKKTDDAKKDTAASTGTTGGARAAVAPVTSDVAQIYEVLAPMAGDYLNAQAEQIGMAQRSMGPLAAAAMGQSQTAGLGNYTYNRLMRPQVDTMRDEILVRGYVNQLNDLLSRALNNARNRYNNGGGTTKSGNSGVNKDTALEEDESSRNGYKHVGSADKDTGQWIDEEASKKNPLNPSGKDVLSGESPAVNNPVTDFFSWIGQQLGAGTEIGGNAQSIKDALRKGQK